MRVLLSIAVSLSLAPVAAAGELRVYPPDIRISGPNRTQHLIVVEEENGRAVRDLAAEAKFTSSSDKVKVNAAGEVTATTAGDFTVTVAGSSRVDLQACKLEYSIVSPK